MRDTYADEDADVEDFDEDRFERRYDCDRCGDTGWDGHRPCYKCDAHDLRKPDADCREY